jgi:hypothetical protein
MIWGYRFVHCVPVRISPVAVRVAVKSIEHTRMADLLITRDNRGIAGVCTGLASPGYLRGFTFSALLSDAPYCIHGGVRVVSISLSYACRTVVQA